MKIEAGKSYRTRAGRKATIYRVGARSTHPIHGFVDADEEYIARWTETGFRVGEECPGNYDLVSTWVDEPTMDISALPAWATHVWFGGFWWYYESDNERHPIPPRYSPKISARNGSRYRIDREANRLVLEEGGAK